MTDRVYQYKWGEGFRTSVKPDIAAQEIKRIEQERGPVTPAVLIEGARSDKSPLHKMFEWDDKKAAHEHRLYTARKIIMSLRVVVKQGDQPEPMMVSLRTDDAETERDRAYVTLASIGDDPARRHEYMLRELERIEQLLPRTLAFAEFEPLRNACATIRVNLTSEAEATAAD